MFSEIDQQFVLKVHTVESKSLEHIQNHTPTPCIFSVTFWVHNLAKKRKNCHLGKSSSLTDFGLSSLHVNNFFDFYSTLIIVTIK